LIAGAGDFGDGIPNAKKFTRSASKLSEPGDVILGIRASIGEKVHSDGIYCLGRGVAGLRPKAGLDVRYLWNWLTYAKLELSSKGKGATFKQVNRADIGELRIPLPPLPEQRRIAAILDQAETLRTQRRAALAHLDSLTQSIFLDMFGDPATNPKAWALRTIQELCEVKGGKRLPKGSEYSPIPTPFRYVRVTNLRDGRIDESQLLFLQPEIQREIARYVVNSEDIIISIAGSIGLVAAVPDSVDGANLTENAAKLVTKSRGTYVPEFLAFLLRTEAMQGQISSHVGQVTIGKLALFRIEKVTVPLPPLSLQQVFGTRVEAIESLKAKHRAALAELDALFASLQHRAFNGELTAQASAQPKRRTFAELGQLDATKGLEALVYAARRLPNQGHYWPLKAQYVADRHHLERHGRTLYGETHVAMPYGPVPQAAYNASRALANGELICEFPMDAVRAALRRDGETLVALRDADPGVLGAEERESLDWAIRLVADLSFEELKTQTHDAAWEKTPRNEPMAWQDIVATLDPAAQQRLRATFE